jgi:thiol-disulfide isomerase/thioredoxin
MASVLTDDDRPPPPSGRRPPSRGLLVASGLALVILAVMTFVAFRSDDSPEAEEPAALEQGMPFPGELNAGRDVTGESVSSIGFEGFAESPAGSIADFAGQPVVLNFFASWCTPCIEEMPAFEAVHQQVGDRVAFVGINIDHRPEAGLAMVQSTGVTYRLGYDRGGPMLEAFGAVNMPTTAFIRGDGTIAFVQSGKLNQAELEQLIDENLLS